MDWQIPVIQRNVFKTSFIRTHMGVFQDVLQVLCVFTGSKKHSFLNYKKCHKNNILTFDRGTRFSKKIGLRL